MYIALRGATLNVIFIVAVGLLSELRMKLGGV